MASCRVAAGHRESTKTEGLCVYYAPVQFAPVGLKKKENLLLSGAKEGRSERKRKEKGKKMAAGDANH